MRFSQPPDSPVPCMSASAAGAAATTAAAEATARDCHRFMTSSLFATSPAAGHRAGRPRAARPDRDANRVYSVRRKAADVGDEVPDILLREGRGPGRHVAALADRLAALGDDREQVVVG